MHLTFQRKYLMTTAKSLASSGAILLAITIGSAVLFNNYHDHFSTLKRYEDAFNAEQTVKFENLDGYKKTDTAFYQKACEKSPVPDALPDWDCLEQRRASRAGIVALMKTDLEAGTTVAQEQDRLSKNLRRVNDYFHDQEMKEKGYDETDYKFVAWQFEQINFDMGWKKSDIKNPLNLWERYQVYSYNCFQNNTGWAILLGVIGFLMCIPLMWVGFWRGVGIAIRSAKKEVNTK